MSNRVASGSDEVRSAPVLRILHLEDSAEDGEIIAWVLRTAMIPCRIERVEDGESFVAALEKNGVDLILSDSSVPGFSGTAALERALAANIQAPFIFVSGNATTEIRNKALRLGAADFLAKDHRAQLVFCVQRIWQKLSERG